jgi:hypothetical protein
MALPLRRLSKATTKFEPSAGEVVATTVQPTSVRRKQITRETLQNPELLKQTLISIQDAIEEAAKRTSPFDGGTVLVSDDGVTTGLSFVAGTPRVITHRLGHRPEYVAVLSSWTATPEFVRIDQTPDEDEVSIKLMFAHTCRVVLWVGP